jgi:large subunit ribosomal protein L1
MKKHGKRYRALIKKFDSSLVFNYQEAVDIIKKTASAKFDESFDVAIKLGVDPRKADQLVRGTVTLPHGIGKKVRVLVLAKEQKAIEAKEAGADNAGLEEFLEKIKAGWTDTDVIIATPDVMGEVGKLGKILGPRGLMPNPKSGTVTFDVGKAVQEVKAGKIEYRVDKTGNIHASVGKCNFDTNKLAENVATFFTSILRAKPSSAKGKYVKGIYFSSTMGPSVAVNDLSFTTKE